MNGLQISGGRYDFAGPATDAAQQYGFGFTHIFTPNLLARPARGFTRINNFSAPLNYGTNPDTTVGFGSNMNFNSFSNFLTPIQFGPFSDIGDGAYVPLQDIDNTFQYLANRQLHHGQPQHQGWRQLYPAPGAQRAELVRGRPVHLWV